MSARVAEGESRMATRWQNWGRPDPSGRTLRVPRMNSLR